MKPAAFEYQRASSVDEAVQALAQHPGAKVIAGGQSLVPLMNFRLSRPEFLVDINPLAALAEVKKEGQTLSVGALVRHQTLATHEVIRAAIPVLAEAAENIGHWAIRNRGTIGGSAVHADPAAELPAALVALQASVVVAGPYGERQVSAADFFQGFYTVDLSPEELVVRFELPVTGARIGFSEVVRRPGDFALVGAFLENGPAEAAVTWFGLGSRPERIRVDHWPDDVEQRRAVLEERVREVAVEPEDEYKYAMAVSVAERAYHHAKKEG